MWPFKRASRPSPADARKIAHQTSGHRQPIFATDARYRCLRAIPPGISAFEFGEVLTFLSDGYSPYDGAFMYEFRSEPSGELKTWLLSETSPTSSWKDYFEPV
jgi:hypothetical protein